MNEHKASPVLAPALQASRPVAGGVRSEQDVGLREPTIQGEFARIECEPRLISIGRSRYASDTFGALCNVRDACVVNNKRDERAKLFTAFLL